MSSVFARRGQSGRRREGAFCRRTGAALGSGPAFKPAGTQPNGFVFEIESWPTDLAPFENHPPSDAANWLRFANRRQMRSRANCRWRGEVAVFKLDIG